MPGKQLMREASNAQNKGFSLVELLVVTVLMGIISAIALPSFFEWRERLQYRQAGREVMTSIRTARSRAIATNRQQRVELDVVNRTYSIRPGERAVNSPWAQAAGPATLLQPGRVGIESIGRTPANNGIRYNFIVCNPNGTFLFDDNPDPAPPGNPENRGVVLTIFDNQQNVNATQNSQRYRIELTQTGRITGNRVAQSDIYPPP